MEEKVRIMIVDDSKTSRKLLRGILERGGYEVVCEAVDGEDGWQKYKEVRPDLVTMDITMPKMDGVEALSMIRKDNPTARVVMISASGQREKMTMAIRRGASDFITKPFEEKKVLATIGTVLEE
ncbi:MAG: response regulator [Lachnospiraceae bacterium]|nr:response regulator [Lachnospiraceae bacterium]